MTQFFASLLNGRALSCFIPLSADTPLDAIPMRLFVEEIRQRYYDEVGDDNFQIIATFAPHGERTIRHRRVTTDDLDELVDFRYLQTLCKCFFIVPSYTGEHPDWKELDV